MYPLMYVFKPNALITKWPLPIVFIILIYNIILYIGALIYHLSINNKIIYNTERYVTIL